VFFHRKPVRVVVTCESVVSAIAAGQAASFLGQEVDELGCPVRTHDGEDGGDAFRVEHDAVSLQSSRQRGLDFLDVDVPGDAIVQAQVPLADAQAGCAVLGVGLSGCGYAHVAAMAADQKRIAVVAPWTYGLLTSGSTRSSQASGVSFGHRGGAPTPSRTVSR